LIRCGDVGWPERLAPFDDQGASRNCEKPSRDSGTVFGFQANAKISRARPGRRTAVWHWRCRRFNREREGRSRNIACAELQLPVARNARII